LAQGLKEAVQPDYLRLQDSLHAYLGDALDAAGVPVVKPIGAMRSRGCQGAPHHIPPLQYPGQALAVAFTNRVESEVVKLAQ